MTAETDPVKEALSAETRWDIARALGPIRPTLTLPDVKRLTRQLSSLDDETQAIRVAVLRTYTTELLEPYWQLEAKLQGFTLELYEAPYGSLLQELEPGAGLLEHNPDLTLVFLQWEDLDPRFGKPLTSYGAGEQADLHAAGIRYLVGLLGALRDRIEGSIVVTLLPRPFGPELGAFDAMAADSEASFRGGFKAALASQLRESLPGTHFADLDEVAAQVGRAAMFDPRLWYGARYPFSVAASQTVTARLMRYAVVLKQPPAKCIVLDADNTLWGGIIGEDGPQGIELGPDYPGSVYVAFQRRLLEFRQRGFLLALCSKNNSADVLEVLKDHPHQLLREEDFAAMVINWLPKPGNLRTLAQDLNVGTDSFVFIDDSPHECLAVRRELPEVTVVQTPSDITLLPVCLDEVARLEILSLTEEDRRRTKLYAQQRKRAELSGSSANLDEYLASLKMVMAISIDEPEHVRRIAQLTQKTNQFNLTTRRYSEADIGKFMSDPDWIVADFRLADVFGDSGLVGVALVSGVAGSEAKFDTFLMSCRVIGRRVETAFLAWLLDELRRRGLAPVRGEYVPSGKNEVVSDFWARHGFSSTNDGFFQIDLSEPVRIESPVSIVNGASRL